MTDDLDAKTKAIMRRIKKKTDEVPKPEVPKEDFGMDPPANVNGSY